MARKPATIRNRLARRLTLAYGSRLPPCAAGCVDTLFRAHFEGGRPDAEVPELQGIGILTDGDQTNSVSAADYAGFVLYKQQDRNASR